MLDEVMCLMISINFADTFAFEMILLMSTPTNLVIETELVDVGDAVADDEVAIELKNCNKGPNKCCVCVKMRDSQACFNSFSSIFLESTCRLVTRGVAESRSVNMNCNHDRVCTFNLDSTTPDDCDNDCDDDCDEFKDVDDVVGAFDSDADEVELDAVTVEVAVAVAVPITRPQISRNPEKSNDFSTTAKSIRKGVMYSLKMSKCRIKNN